MIKDWPWIDDFKTGGDVRFYFDPRQQEYPHVNGAPVFTAVDSWRYGSHDLTGGYAHYLVSIHPMFSFEIKLYPDFAYDVASDQPVFSWQDEEHGLELYYDSTLDKFALVYKNGINRYMYSRQFDDGSSYEDISQWLVISGSIDLTTGTDSGSELYINRVLDSDTWDDTIFSLETEHSILGLRYGSAGVGNYKFNYFRYFPGITVTAADVSNGFKNVYDEEIFFDFNGVAVGRSRCNISRFVANYSYKETYETQNGSFSSNGANLDLYNEGLGADGCFSDDQYAPFDAGSYQYNGTIDNKYLQNRIPVWFEAWHGNDFDSVYRGKVDSGAFARTKVATKMGRVKVSAEDAVRDIAIETKRRARAYEDFTLCNNAIPSESLLHTILRLATKKEIYNYLSNSGFEVVTSYSWKQESNVTLTRVERPLLGTYSGQATFSGAGELNQTVTFDGDIKLNVGDSWTFSIYIYRINGYLVTEAGDYIVTEGGDRLIIAEPFDLTVRLSEADSGGVNDSTSITETIDPDIPDGWKKFTVVHKITDADSNRLKVSIETDGAGLVLLDVAMLTYGKRDGNWFVLNNTLGFSGVIEADRAVADSYDSIAFNLTNNLIYHPWVRIEEGEGIWQYCKDIAHATPNLQYFGMTADNVFEYKHTPTEAGDPAIVSTVQIPVSLAVNLDAEGANRIIVSGCKITKEDSARPIWMVTPGVSGVDSSGGLGQYTTIIGPGGVWPDPTEYGSYYGEVDTI